MPILSESSVDRSRKKGDGLAAEARITVTKLDISADDEALHELAEAIEDTRTNARGPDLTAAPVLVRLGDPQHDLAVLYIRRARDSYEPESGPDEGSTG